MCGIIGAVAERNVVPILMEGLRRLEYRGYDSAGVALVDQNQLSRHRSSGKVAELAKLMEKCQPTGHVGIAHTRWATHGEPSENNAHPHTSGNNLALVHNGILENYLELKQTLLDQGIEFHSETDSEVITHYIQKCLQDSSEAIVPTLQNCLKAFKGTFALGLTDVNHPDRIFAIRQDSPLVVGIGIGEYYIASDPHALAAVTLQYIVLEDGDIADLHRDRVQIFDELGKTVYDSQAVDKAERKTTTLQSLNASHDKGDYRHFMLKEIHEQPQAIINSMQNALSGEKVNIDAFGMETKAIVESIDSIYILACGTSYHAGLVAKYWIEDIVDVQVNVEIASEFRYRNPVIKPNTLFIAISQSGETADTLEAIKLVKERRKKTENLPILCICNTHDSALVRQSDLIYLTHAGVEVGVASTKAFTTQLVSLALFMVVVGKVKNKIDTEQENRIVQGLRKLPALIVDVLKHEAEIAELAQDFIDTRSAIFLGRGVMYPVALEGALKLKEISYIHAEAFAAAELKHGPLALVDDMVQVVAVAPHDELLAKLKANLKEVGARGGKLLVFEDEKANVRDDSVAKVIPVTSGVGRVTSPIIFSIPLQLLAYHAALNRGTDIDQPRNLAKAVTVG